MIIAPYIEVTPDACGHSEPVIIGTAWTVAEIVGLTSKGMKPRDIRKHLHAKKRTALTDEAIAACERFARDSFCTPEPIAKLLPLHDWDPCSNPYSHVRAVKTCMLERGEDGLKADWSGVLYCNGPFSGLMPFVEKLLASPRVSTAAFMVNVDSSTKWWKLLADYLGSIFFFEKRIPFQPYPGLATTTNNKPQALIAHRRYFDLCDPGLFQLGSIWERSAA